MLESAARRVGLLLYSLMLAACAPDSPTEQLSRATEQYAAGDYRVAFIELRNVLQAQPGNIEARLLLGRTLAALADYESAVVELERAAELGADPAEYAWTLADSLSRLGRGDQASEVLARVPEDARGAAWFSAEGAAQLAAGDPDLARMAFERALAISEGRETYAPLVGLARVDGAGGRLDQALGFATRAIEVEPEGADAYLARGSVRISSRDIVAAEQDLTRGAELLAQGPVTVPELRNLLVLAELQFTLRDTEGLARTAELASQRVPDSFAHQFAVGALSHVSGDYAEAERRLQTAATLDPGSSSVSLMLGVNSLAMGNLGQAEQHLLNVLNAQPGDVAATRLLAETRRRQGRPEAALVRVEQLAAADSDPTLLALRGVLYLESGSPEQAALLLERALQAVPGELGLQLQLARSYLASNREEAATALFADSLGTHAERAVEVAAGLVSYLPDDDAALSALDEMLADADVAIDSMVGGALFLFAMGDHDEAGALLERVVEDDPGAIEPRLLLAGMAVAADDSARARAIYQSILDTTPAEYRAWLGLARLAARDQIVDEALRLTEQAAAVAPDAWLPQLLLGRVRLAGGDWEGAQAAADRALASAPDNPDVLTLAGQIALQNAQPAAAVEHFRRAVLVDPTRIARRFLLARAEIEVDNFSEATAIARQLQAEMPRSPEPYLLEAAALIESGDVEAALPLFEVAFERQPSFAIAATMARLRQQTGSGDPAAPLERWLSMSPEDVGAWLLLAQTRQSQLSMDAALEAYENVLRLQPDELVALNNAAWIYNESGDERALILAERAYSLAPGVAAVLDTYGWVLFEQRGADAALPVLQAAAEAGPDVGDIQYHYAHALAATGDTARARAILERILADDTAFSARDGAEALLSDL